MLRAIPFVHRGPAMTGFRFAARLAPALSLVLVAPASADATFAGPYIQRVEPGHSRPLGELPTVGARPSAVGENEPRVPPDWLADRVGWGADVGPRDPLISRMPEGGPNTPSPLATVQGMSNTCGCSPPDPMIAAGPSQVVQVVNATSLSVYDKTGAPIVQNVAVRTLWASGNCAASNDGDPTVTYDWLADRWVIAQFSTGDAICVAVSQTPSATGAYFTYEFATPSFPDYFKIGAFGNAYFVGANESTYSALALNRTAMLAGQAATSLRFSGQQNFLMPATLGGTTAPPQPNDGLFYTFKDDTFHGGGPDRLEFYQFHVDFQTPANASFNLVATIPVASFTYTVCGFFVLGCVPQPGTTRRVDAVSEWPMWQLQYRNFGVGDERLVGSFTVDGGADVAAVRWFEVRRNASVFSLQQEGTIGGGTDNRFMTSTAMDRCGNIAVGYSVSSGTTTPSLRYATRLAGDPAGTMQAEATLFAGTGVQTGSNRWGDYAAVVLDPQDECTFWMTGEYFAATSSNNWTTRIGKFRLPECSTTCGVTPPGALLVDGFEGGVGDDLFKDGFE